jgi:hypothetical protein
LILLGNKERNPISRCLGSSFKRKRREKEEKNSKLPSFFPLCWPIVFKERNKSFLLHFQKYPPLFMCSFGISLGDR